MDITAKARQTWPSTNLSTSTFPLFSVSLGLLDTIFGGISFKTRYRLSLLFGYYNNDYNHEYDSSSQQMALVLIACWCFTCNTVTILAGLVAALLEGSRMILSAFR